MRSQFLNLKMYDTDKVQHGYLKLYDPIFSDYVDKEINLLEIGVLKGGSLILWRDYFPKGRIFGIDLNAPLQLNKEERIKVFSGSQQDENFLSTVAKDAAGGFDIIIDDASHIGKLTQISFWHLFENHLKPGGIYVIEDWGTGYWGDWPDGEVYLPAKGIRFFFYNFLRRIGVLKGDYFYSHSFGMVGFIKQLVDEQGFADVSRQYLKGKVKRISKFESITITSSMVFIKKRSY
jgi:SAM-dependent methyltransferase